MRSIATESMNPSTPSSPSISLADFDYDSESPPVEVRNKAGPSPPLIIQAPTSQGQTAMAGIYNDVATKDDIASLRQLVQQEFEQLKLQKSTPLPPPTVEIPKEAFTDALRAEMAVQLAKISALEEENRKLRAEKQQLRTALDRAENQPGLQADLNAANQELKRVYIERQGLWDERAALWKERGELWEERANLWSERQSLWDERGKLWEERDDLQTRRDELIEKVKVLEARESK